MVSQEDEFHSAAMTTYEALIDREQNLLATSYVLSETIALVHRRLGFDVVNSLWDSIGRVIRTHWIEESIHREAWREFTRKQGSGPSFVDWTTIVAARRTGAHVFTFDRAFSRENIAVLPSSL